MTAALLTGGGVGLGLWLLIAGLFPARPTLLATLDRHQACSPSSYAPTVSGTSQTPDSAGWQQLARFVGEQLGARWNSRGLSPSLRADLAVTDTALETFVVRKLGWALGGLLTPVLAAMLLAAAGLRLPLLIPMWIAMTSALVAFLLPDLRLRHDAAERRRIFRAAVGAFLDLVAMRMASGAGLSEALHDGAATGTGPAFVQLRGALADARTDGLTAAAALGRLGAELKLPDLIDTATRLRLVDSNGAQAQASLRAHAGSLRDRELSDAQGRAGEQSQSMLIAQILLGFGFVLLLGYPAVAAVLAT